MKFLDIKVLLLLFFTANIFAQVGVGTEKPEADLDIHGSIRLRKLGTIANSTRMLLSNEKGDVGFFDLGKDSYRVKDVFYKIMDKPTISTARGASLYVPRLPLIELLLDIEVEIAPRTTTAVTMEYNVPITALIDNSTRGIPSYIGVTLVKNEGGGAVELDEGSRKFSFYDVNAQIDSQKCLTMPVSGKATDVITNNSNSKMVVSYSAKGYIENGVGTLYFGEVSSGDSSFGSGVFVVQVYEKEL